MQQLFQDFIKCHSHRHARVCSNPIVELHKPIHNYNLNTEEVDALTTSNKPTPKVNATIEQHNIKSNNKNNEQSWVTVKR